MIKNILISLAILISFDAFSADKLRDDGKYYFCEVKKGCEGLEKGDIFITDFQTWALLYCDQDKPIIKEERYDHHWRVWCFFNGKAIKDQETLSKKKRKKK